MQLIPAVPLYRVLSWLPILFRKVLKLLFRVYKVLMNWVLLTSQQHLLPTCNPKLNPLAKWNSSNMWLSTHATASSPEHFSSLLLVSTHSCIILAFTSFGSLYSCPSTWSDTLPKAEFCHHSVSHNIIRNYLCAYYLLQNCKLLDTHMFFTIFSLVSSTMPGTELALSKYFLNELTEYAILTNGQNRWL